MRAALLRVFLLSSTRVSTHRSSLPGGKGLVVPIFKKGDKCCPGNYRPISLLPAISKVLERVVHNKLSDFLRSWLTSNQSGFKKSDDTVPQLVRMTQEWSNAVDDGQYVAAVFINLKKAFDRVWHQGLFTKLRAAGIKGAVHEWLVNFLTDRVQVTVVNGTISTSARLFLRFCRTWTKRYLVTSQTRDNRVSRIHHRTILERVWPMMHLHPRCLDRPLGPSFRSEMEKDLRSETWTQWTIEAARVKVHHQPYSFEDGPVVYPANAFYSRLRGA